MKETKEVNERQLSAEEGEPAQQRLVVYSLGIPPSDCFIISSVIVENGGDGTGANVDRGSRVPRPQGTR